MTLPNERCRYFTQDNWNILDTASIAFLLVAFLFRVLALVLKANQDVFGPILGADDFSEQARHTLKTKKWT